MLRAINLAKGVVIVAFLVTLSTTYYLRSEVLELNTIRFSSEDLRAEDNLRQLKESYPQRVAEYEAAMKNYRLQQQHYERMLDLYQRDTEEYLRRIQAGYHPPVLPHPPSRPRSPELSDELAAINATFRAQQYRYFESTSRLNWVACASALCLVGGLLFLLMFDPAGPRLIYLAVLVLSFVFMIGPSFHSIMSAVVGFLRAPDIH